jgi:hypothetical protein
MLSTSGIGIFMQIKPLMLSLVYPEPVEGLTKGSTKPETGLSRTDII